MWAVLLVALAGCRPDFFTVNEACPKHTRGIKKLEDSDKANAKAVERVNCYRRLATVKKGAVNRHLTDAVGDHVNYLAANDPRDELAVDLIGETVGNPGYTGATPDERYLNRDYDLEPGESGIWLIFDAGHPDELSGPKIIDDYMHDPYIREALLQPDWEAAGVAEASTSDDWAWWEMDIVYEYPANEHKRHPIVYPKDGQLNVPLDVITNIDDEDPFAYKVYGYAITVTVGASRASGAFTDPNPYGLIAVEHKLIGPNGEVELFVREPHLDPTFSIIYLPAEPLEPNGTYFFRATIQWSEGQKDIETDFETGQLSVVDQWSQAGRRTPQFRHLRPGTRELRDHLGL